KGWGGRAGLRGPAVWLILLGTGSAGGLPLGPIDVLLLLAVLVCTPLALALAAEGGDPDRDGPAYRAARGGQPFAAALVVASYGFPPGSIAAGLAAGWLAFTALVALAGLGRLRARGLGGPAQCCADA